MTLEELIEARKLLEVPAARLAAERRSEEHLDRLRESIPGEPLRLDTQEQFVYNAGLPLGPHRVLRNTLLYIAAQPVFSALQTNLARSPLGRRFHREINDHHRLITEAIEAADAQAAGG